MSTPAPAPLVLECDEVGTVVTRHTRSLWIWLAMARHSRQIVGCFMGARDEVSAFGLWQSLPTPDLDARCHTDRLGAYTSVVYGRLHVIGGTQHVERFNATLRLQVAHLIRRSPAFSRTQAQPEPLIWMFIHHCNASLR